MKYFISILISILCYLMLPQSVLARGGGGGHSLGFGVGLVTPSQDDLNTVINEINAAESRAIDKLGSAYEFDLYYQYRFSGSMFALQFRPSYVMQSSSGGGYDTKLTGYSLFPMLRLYPLENNFLKFFLQTGVGYGRLSGSMSGPNGKVEWSGGAFGAAAGLGAEFCFTDEHCMVVEGNLRYLPIERNIVSSTSGTVGGFDTPSTDGELENGNMDVKTTLSGIQGIISYQMNF
jgi:hypothetical protein